MKQKMEQNNNISFNSIDVFKLICALLIVCIHTDPLENYNILANYILVDIFARIAVPFFFVAS